MNIKITSVFLTLCVMLVKIQAQTLEPIYSFATELKPVNWYREQASLWHQEIKKDNKNALAWYNYYRANRNLYRLDTTDTRTREEKWNDEKKLVAQMEESVPESFEYNLCKWMIGGNDDKYLPYLKKAASLGENRYEIVADMIVLGEKERNITLRNQYAKIWYESKLASPGLLNYNYNVIIGLKPNAILLTAGDNDTYPIWQLQSQGIRKDITVLNLSLLNIDSYRDKIFKELGIPKWDTTMHSGKNIYDHNPYHKEIIKHIANNSKNTPVYIALTTGPEYTQSIEDQLYLTGLSYEYSTNTIDNIASLKKNFEQLYRLDYIEHTFYKDISIYYALRMNQNYIVPMLKLYDHYFACGDLQKQEWIKHKILVLAQHSNEKEAIKKLLKQP